MEIKITLKTINLTKSKIKQLIFKDTVNAYLLYKYTPLGWVNMDGKRYAIIEIEGSYYRAPVIKEIKSTVEGRQFSDGNEGWVFPQVTVVKFTTFLDEHISTLSIVEEEEKNLKNLELLQSAKHKIEEAGQLFY